MYYGGFCSLSTLLTWNALNKCIQPNFFTAMFYLTHITPQFTWLNTYSYKYENTVAVTADVMCVKIKAKINIGVNGIHVETVESFNSCELNRCCS